MNLRKRTGKLLSIFMIDLLEALQAFMLSMILLHIYFVDDIETIISINIYMVTSIYLLAMALKIVLTPLLKEGNNV